MDRPARYRQLLRDYHAALGGPHEGRPAALAPLAAEMDRLWDRLRPGEREQVLGYARELYEARIV